MSRRGGPLRPLRRAHLALLGAIALGPLTGQATPLPDLLQTGAGLYASIGLHELGHALVLKSLGADEVEIRVPDPDGGWVSGVTRSRRPLTLTPSQAQTLSVAGLVAGNLAGEWVLQSPGLHHSAMARSLLATAQLTNVANVWRYYTRVRGENGWQGNDIDQFELAGGNPHLLSAALLGYTVFTLHRMRQREIPLYGLSLRF